VDAYDLASSKVRQLTEEMEQWKGLTLSTGLEWRAKFV
jgi:hypothetical protein